MTSIIKFTFKHCIKCLLKPYRLKFMSTITVLDPQPESQIRLPTPQDRALITARKGLLCEVLGCEEDVAQKMIDGNTYLLVKREVNIRRKAVFARQYFSLEDIIKHSELLTLSLGPIQHQFFNMKEFGFRSITCSTLLAYNRLFRKSAVELIELNHMEPTCDPVDHVLSVVSSSEFSRQIKQELTLERITTTSVLNLHRMLLQRYLSHRLGCSLTHAQFLVELHTQFSGTPFSYVKECFAILQEDLKFTIEKIRVNPYLLHQDPSNLRSILSLPSLMGGNTFEMAAKFPKVISQPLENLLGVEAILRDYGVQDDVLRTCRYLFLLNPETVENLIIKRKIKKMIGR